MVLPEGLPLTSSDVIARLNEHLLNVLSQLHKKEAELGQAQEALEKFQRKFSVIIHQQVRDSVVICILILFAEISTRRGMIESICLVKGV